MMFTVRRFPKYFFLLFVFLSAYSSQNRAQTFNAEGAVCLPTAPFFSGCRTFQTQPDCDTVCAGSLFDDGCFNEDGQFVTPACVCSNSNNSVEAIRDIEIALGIDIDDRFVEVAGYQGPPPALNPIISVQDAERFFSAILQPDQASLLLSLLNLNGDALLERNEASLAKSNPALESAFGCNLWAVDNLLALLGLYLPNGSVDRYQGSLNPDIFTALLGISRAFFNSESPLEPVSEENNSFLQPDIAEVARSQAAESDRLNQAEAIACNTDPLSAACLDARAASEAARQGN